MSLQNALGDIALDVTVQDAVAELNAIYAALGGKATTADVEALGVKIDAVNTKTPALESGRVPVALSGSVPITDGGGSITIDGSVTITDGSGPLTVDGTVAVSNSSIAVTDNGGSLTVDGTVAISNTVFAVTDNGGSLTVDAASLPLPLGAATETTLAAVNTKVPSQGQALAAASIPVVLPAAQQAALTPPAAITGFATAAKQDSLQTRADLLATESTQIANATFLLSMDGKTPALGQALAAASVPAVLPEAQITALTPPAAITGFATEATLAANAAAVTASGTISTQNLVPAGAATASSSVELVVAGRDTLIIQTVGTYTGILSLQGTVNGTVWVTLSGASRVLNHNTGAYSATIASAAQSIFETSVSGLLRVRVTALAAVTGSVVVSLSAVDGNAQVALDTALPAGSAAIGTVAVSSVTTAVQPGTGSTHLGKAEDAGHTTADTGVFMLGVRNDNAATLPTSANADYSQVSVDQAGAVFTHNRPGLTATLSNVASATSSTTVLAANAARRFASIQNDGAATLKIKFGATASATSYTVDVAANSYYVVPETYTGVLDGIWSATGTTARVTELV